MRGDPRRAAGRSALRPAIRESRQPATGRPYRVRGASAGTLNSEGLISTNRDYWNMAEVLAQIGFTPG
ncbi:MAG: hypothetical protein ACM3ML_36675 [Micromonosporaceae bacterium]